MTDSVSTAGPNRDGSKSLAPESKAGLIVSFGLSVAGTALLGYLNQLDLTTLPGWLGGAATYAVAGIGGAVTAYLKRNR